MSKRVVLVGHCGPDSSYLRLMVQQAIPGARVLVVEDAAELAAAIAEGVDLLLINRVLDYGYEQTEGVPLISDLLRRHPGIKTMLVSNFPEAQAAGLAAGAVGAFGKRELGSARVQTLLHDAVAETKQNAQ